MYDRVAKYPEFYDSPRISAPSPASENEATRQYGIFRGRRPPTIEEFFAPFK